MMRIYLSYEAIKLARAELERKAIIFDRHRRFFRIAYENAQLFGVPTRLITQDVQPLGLILRTGVRISRYFAPQNHVLGLARNLQPLWYNGPEFL